MARAVVLVFLGILVPAMAAAHLPGLAAPGEAVDREPMAELEVMVGQWSLTGRERGVGGDTLAASGVRTCRWALAGTAIRCDDRYHWFGASAGAQQVSIEDSLFYLTFNSRTGTYEYTYYSADLPELQTVSARYDPVRGTLTGIARFSAPEGEDLLAKSVSQFLSPDRMLEKLSISILGSGRETQLLELELERRYGPLPPVVHF